MSNDLLIFEQPVTERVRTFLRLDFLFRQLQHHLDDASPWGRRSCVQVMLDVLTLFSRSDLRKEVAKELAELQSSLQKLQAVPGIDHGVLENTLSEIATASESLSAAAAQASGSLLRESDFMLGIINRSAIPGGTCPFDMPGYERWLAASPEDTAAELQACLAEIFPYRDAIALFLRLLRQSAQFAGAVTENGVYTQSLDGPCRLIRIGLPRDSQLFPEVSAGRQRFTIRLMSLGSIRERNTPVEGPAEFGLALCSL